MKRSYKTVSVFLIAAIISLCIFLLKQKSGVYGYNVILITIDALRADHMSCYGYRKDTTPFLNLFSKNSFIFLNAVAQSGSTVPSIASMFTSKYPYKDKVVWPSYALGSNYITVASFLKKLGYRTYGIVGHYYLARKFGFARGFDYFDDNFHIFRSADEMRELTIKLLRKMGDKKKFFLWLHFREPHSPYSPPDSYNEIYFTPFQGQNRKRLYTIYGKKTILSDRQVHELSIAYDANIRFVDDNLRQIFDYLKEIGLNRKTVIIITADHGESLGEHGIFDHNDLYYGIIRVPLIIQFPNCPGGAVAYPVSLVDLFPTILDLLNFKGSMPDLRGESVFARQNTHTVQYSEYPDKHSLISEEWRICLNLGGKNNAGLYNLKSDPLEFNNLAHIEKERFRILKQQLGMFMLPDSRDRNIKPGLDMEDKIRLESLGYVQ